MGFYLRATVTYNDGEGEDKSAMATSAHTVQAINEPNDPPVFPDQDPDTSGGQSDTATRMVEENTDAGEDVGLPVEADDDDNDILTYTLSGTDADDFDIEPATGQILTKSDLDADAAGQASYTVTVTATDPAGATDGITVTITVTGVNETPEITGDVADYAENGMGVVADFMATDPELVNPVPTLDLSGTDASLFTLTGGTLAFNDSPNFEAPGDADEDNTYELTVGARDADGNRGTRDIEVKVTNVNEDGTVTLSAVQPRVGVAVTASLTDIDGAVSGVTWQWSAGNTAIGDATSDTYTPTATDSGTLTATAMYTDPQGPDKMASVASAQGVAADTRNKAPVFDDQDGDDTNGIQNTEATRTIAENAAADIALNGGGPVTATDPNAGAPLNDTVSYRLGGADASSFDIGLTSGMITVGAGTDLDFETKTTYMVTVIATDSYGESSSIAVTITVTDENEGPVISVALTVAGQSSIEYKENATSTVETYTAADPEMTAIVSWSLGGDDAGVFDIEGGMLTFKKSPDFEAPTGGASDNSNTYSVIVQADDETGKMGTKEVTVEVTDVNEVPDVAGKASIEYKENATSTVETYTAADPEMTAIVSWSLGGDDAGVFDIEGGMLTFKKSPDFEAPTGGASDNSNTYSVIVQADDETGKMGTKEVTVEVTDVNEVPDVAGEASIVYEENATGTVAIYTAEDPEGAEIVWSLGGDDAGDFTINGGELAFSSAPDFESPADMDEDNVYQVTVKADDGTYMDTQDVTVTVTDVDDEQPQTPLARYDDNNTGRIDKHELANAVFDYNIEQTLSRDDLADLIFSYEIGG